MHKLFHLVRTERQRRAGVDGGTELAVTRYFSNESLLHVRGTELDQVPGETFEAFEARAIAAAKASGDTFVVICISDDAPARAVRVAMPPSAKSVEEMTDAELLIIATDQGAMREFTDPQLEAFAHA